MERRLATPPGVLILGAAVEGHEDILSYDALSYLATLHRQFNRIRISLLAQREKTQRELDSGLDPEFLSETAEIRSGDWAVNSIPEDLATRRVEITGPVTAKLIINALNSGADSYMADFEDSNTPTWENLIKGQINLKSAVRRKLSFVNDSGKAYELNEHVATLVVRPRGWHLDEKHVLIDNEPVSGSLFDFALYMFHNAQELVNRGSGPYFYLPKLESYKEARLWNSVFKVSQSLLGVASGTIKATVLIEHVLAAFQMEEILFELREHSAGLNAGRWDYIFSCIKKFRSRSEFCLADRSLVTMTAPFMRAYSLLLVKTCHRRGAPAIGGMSAFIPIANDKEASEKALQGVRLDKARDARDGFDGGWVAHPGLVNIAMEEWKNVLGNRANQMEFQPNNVNITPQDLLNFQPSAPITELGLMMNVDVAIQYLGSWLSGVACVPINNLMEDAATAEICRAQVWQWLHSSKGVMEDGRRVSPTLLRHYIELSLNKLKKNIGEIKFTQIPYVRASKIFEEMCIRDDFVEFLTTPLYREINIELNSIEDEELSFSR